MKKEDLNYEPFYYIQPLRLIEDPGESVMFLLKYMDEKLEIDAFLKTCSLEDFISVIIFIFKNEYADGALLSSFISKTISKKNLPSKTLYIDAALYRKDLKKISSIYNLKDQFESMSFEFTTPLPAIHAVIADVLQGKQYTRTTSRYTLEADSGIEYLEVSPTSFELKANMDKAKSFQTF